MRGFAPGFDGKRPQAKETRTKGEDSEGEGQPYLSL